jgi:hypothetical protein
MTLATATIRRLVAAAHSAPSGENCQPFHYAWDGRRLRVEHVCERADYRLNAGNHESLLALGCAIEAIDITASAEGLRARFETLAGLGRDDGPWLEVGFEAGERDLDELSKQLALRTTDRRPFDGGDASDPVLSILREESKRVEGVELGFAIPVSDALLDYVLRCDRALWIDRQCLRDTAKWVRYSEAEIVRHHDGLPWQNLGLRRAEAVGGALARRFPVLLDLAGALGGSRQTRRILERQVRSAVGLGCYAVTEAGPAALIEAGRAAMRGWLRLSRAGYGVQPIMLPALGPYNRLAGAFPADLPPEVEQLFDEGVALMRREFAFERDARPIWMYRFGRSTRLPTHMRAPRLPMQQVLRFEIEVE